MKKMIFTSLALAASFHLAHANELDRSDANATPASLVVRVDSQGNQTVYTSEIAGKIKSDAEAESIAASLQNSEKVKAVPFNELDSQSSQQAWGYYYYPRYYRFPYSYSYYRYGYYTHYRPYYTYYYNSYYYYYYCRW